MRILFAFSIFTTALVWSSCDDDVELISRYQQTWEVAVNDITLSPLTVWAGTLQADGTTTVLLTEQRTSSVDQKIWVVRIDATGGQRTVKEIGAGVFLMDVTAQSNGGIFAVLQNATTGGRFERVSIDPALNVQRIEFQINLPSTFHDLTFTPNHYFISEYLSGSAGIRVRQFTYEHAAGWNQTLTKEQIKPFPVPFGDDLIFYRTDSENFLGLTSIIAATGAERWNTNYIPGVLANRLPPGWMFSPFFSRDELLLANFNLNTRQFVAAKVNTSDGSISEERTVAIPPDLDAANPVSLLSDGGLLVVCNTITGTSVLKTDRQGNIGWRGNFVPNGRVFARANGPLVVATPQKIYMLEPVVE